MNEIAMSNGPQTLANKTLTGRIDALLEAAFRDSGLPAETAKASRGTRPELADLQCNGAFSLAKALGKPPREVAETIAAKLRENSAFASVEVANPGFINLRLSASFLAQNAEAQAAAERGGIVQQDPQRILLDFGGPNVAKPLHVGHLRSLVIGESLRRILIALGHQTISDIHLGDWGLQMGMLIAEIRRHWPELPFFAAPYAQPGSSGAETPLPFGMEDLQRLYPQAAAACKEDPNRMAEAREMTAALQAGHPGYMSLWRAIRGISLDAQRRDIDLLDAHFDLLLGESDVQSLIPDMNASLQASGIAIESEGALIIEVADEKDAKPMPPLLLVKSDGAALYATTDLATILERTRENALDRIIYVVDQRQALHFEQVFRAARRAGFAQGVELIHAGFGTVNGRDGKPYKTRQGGVAQLADLLGDAINKARERLEARAAGDSIIQDGISEEVSESAITGAGAENTEAQAGRETLARLVGLAAVKFADLSSYRISGYNFDPDRMVSFEGRTGPYIQYACVRIGSILARAAAQGYTAGPISIEAPAERTLVLDCARFPEVVASAAANLAPNEIADYVFGLAQTFSKFYTDCPVLTAESVTSRASRLALCVLTQHVLVEGLSLLGIAVPRKM